MILYLISIECWIDHEYIYIIHLKPPGLGLLGHTYLGLVRPMRFLIPIAIFGGESIIFARVGGTSKEKSYHLVMTHIAMENPLKKWRFLAGNIIYKYTENYGKSLINGGF